MKRAKRTIDPKAGDISQWQLQFLHNHLMTLIAQYRNGLLTITDFQSAVSNLKLGSLDGLTDPNTGLRF